MFIAILFIKKQFKRAPKKKKNILQCIVIIHVKRKANSAAHGLTRRTATHDIDRLWSEEISLSIYAIVMREFSVPIWSQDLFLDP